MVKSNASTPIHPLASTPFTVYVPEFTGIKGVLLIAPLFQEYCKAPLPDRTTESPSQIVTSGPALTSGKGLTVNVAFVGVLGQFGVLASTATTVYVPATFVQSCFCTSFV